MSANDDPLQVGEVVKALSEIGTCTLVHVENGHEVNVDQGSGDERERWQIWYGHSEILDKPVLQQALALGFELRADTCSSYTRFVLYRNCHGITAAAIKALSLARLLPGVPPDAWLWVTVYEYDQRDEPPTPPRPWPPVAR